MRRYKEKKKETLVQVYCNCCGKEIRVKDGMLLEGVFPGHAVWGYFSEKDGESHEFDICEACYDKWIASFRIPPEKNLEHELF